MTPKIDEHTSKMTRRQFLKRSLIVLGGGVLAACGADGVLIEQTPWQTPTPYQVLRSPMPPAEQATPEGEGELSTFLRLSSLLTGFSNLDPDLGRVYLESLRNYADLPVDLATLIERTGLNGDSPPQTLEDLEASGIFDNEGTRQVANTITTYWYTGIHAGPEGDVIATYVDALAWKSLPHIKPRTICGAPLFWAENPEPPM